MRIATSKGAGLVLLPNHPRGKIWLNPFCPAVPETEALMEVWNAGLTGSREQEVYQGKQGKRCSREGLPDVDLPVLLFPLQCGNGGGMCVKAPTWCFEKSHHDNSQVHRESKMHQLQFQYLAFPTRMNASSQTTIQPNSRAKGKSRPLPGPFGN